MIKNKALLGILLFISSLFSSYSCSTDKEKETDDANSKKTARVVGYLSSDNFSKITSIQFCKLTHLNLSFANPDNTGNLIFEGDIDEGEIEIGQICSMVKEIETVEQIMKSLI